MAIHRVNHKHNHFSKTPEKRPSIIVDVLIIGGGASGVMAALELQRLVKQFDLHDFKIMLIEQNERIGRKLLATGNGRCNMTHEKIQPDQYLSEQTWCLTSILERYTSDYLVRYFASMGLSLTLEANRWYPSSFQAKSVVQFFEHALNECTQVYTQVHVSAKEIAKQGEYYRIKTHDGDVILTRHLIMATGGLAAPKLGYSDLSIRYLHDLGTMINPCYPALVQLRCKGIPKRLSGIKISARLTLPPSLRHPEYDEINQSGEVLLTDYGISGIPTLNLSGHIAKRLASGEIVQISMDCLPDVTAEDLMTAVLQLKERYKHMPAAHWGIGFLPLKLSEAIYEDLRLSRGSSDTYLSKLKIQQIQKLVNRVKNWSIQVFDTLGYEHAQVMGGGLDLTAVEIETLQVHASPALYVTGEILDICGMCGGFNLHWAFVSGLIAARGILSNVIHKSPDEMFQLPSSANILNHINALNHQNYKKASHPFSTQRNVSKKGLR